MNSMNDGWYEITDIKTFVDTTRSIVFKNYGSQQQEDDAIEQDIIDILSDKERSELDKVLSYEEALSIIKSFAKTQTNKKSQKQRIIINDTLFIEMIQSLGDRLTSNILNSLVNRGLVETAYDEKIDDFIFWIKDDIKKEFEAD